MLQTDVEDTLEAALNALGHEIGPRIFWEDTVIGASIDNIYKPPPSNMQEITDKILSGGNLTQEEIKIIINLTSMQKAFFLRGPLLFFRRSLITSGFALKYYFL